jgi:tetratricopeptide (TPR) repeat protein
VANHLPVDGLLHSEGDVWAVHWDGRVARVRDSRGMRHLAALLARPGTEVHSLELGGAPGGVTSGDAAPLLDERAKAAYKARLGDLADDLAEAEAFNDTERAARAQAEIDALVDQLTAAAGLGGRDRTATTDAERARVAVRRALKSALDRLREVLPDLGAHLDATLRTGVYCAYVPDPASPVRWSVLDGPAPPAAAQAPVARRTAARPRPVVVGRDEERAVLLGAWADGGVALVSGEPGIGKTTLLADLAASVDVVVGGRCDEHVNVPFQPLVEIVRALVELDGAAVVAADAGAGAGALARLVPELGPSAPVPDDVERLLLFDAVAGVVTGAARRRRLLVTVDDAHWAHPATLAMLVHVLRAVADEPCLVVIAHRHTEGEDVLTPFLADVARLDGVARVHLGGLGADAVVALGADVADAERLVAHTGGNPFFLRSLLDAPDEAALPPDVLDVVAGRVQRLSDAARSVLSVVAVAGEHVPARVVMSLAPDLDAVDEVLGAGLLAESGTELSFPHSLVRRAILERTSGVRRAALHADVARTLDAVGAPAAELAFHWMEAGDAVHAARWCGAAANEALRAFAFEEAIEHARRGLELAPDDGALLLALGRARHASGDVLGAREVLQDAIALADRRRDTALLADAAVELGHRGAQVGAHDPAYAALLARAAGAPDDARRATVLARLAIEVAGARDVDAARAHADEALELARRVADPAVLLRALTAAHHVNAGPDLLDRRIELADEISALALAGGGVEWQWLGIVSSLTNHVERGDIDAVDAALADLERLVVRTGMPHWRWYLSEQQALRAVIAGDLDAADAAAHRALEVGLAASVPNAVRGYSVQIFVIRDEQGRAHELADAAVDIAAEDDSFAVMAAYACTTVDRDDDARSLLASVDLSSMPRDSIFLGNLCAAAMTAMHLDDTATASVVHEHLAPYAGRVVSIALGTIALGPVDRYLSYAARTIGDLDRARTHLTDAIALDERLRAARWLDRDRTDLRTWARAAP